MMSYHCVFCYESCDGDAFATGDDNGVDIRQMFLNLIRRHIKVDATDKLEDREEFPLDSSACQRCVAVLHSCCDAYHRMKLVELEVNRKLYELMDVIRTADRETKADDEKLKRFNGFGEVETFRSGILQRCSSKLLRSGPQVSLKRCKDEAPAKEMSHSIPNKLLKTSPSSITATSSNDPPTCTTSDGTDPLSENKDFAAYQCAECRLSFRRKSLLVRHLFRGHRVQMLHKWAVEGISDSNFLASIDTVLEACTTERMSCRLCQRPFTFRREVELHLLEKHFQRVGSALRKYQLRHFPNTTSKKSIETPVKPIFVTYSSGGGNQSAEKTGRRKSTLVPRQMTEESEPDVVYDVDDDKPPTDPLQAPETNEELPLLTIYDIGAPLPRKRKPIHCPVCSKLMADKFSLKRHFNIHRGLKQYECLHCGARFRDKANLSSHTYRVHRDKVLKRYKVWSTSRSGFLIALNSVLDELIHNNAQCGLCGKEYQKRVETERHLMQVHEERVGADVMRAQLLMPQYPAGRPMEVPKTSGFSRTPPEVREEPVPPPIQIESSYTLRVPEDDSDDLEVVEVKLGRDVIIEEVDISENVEVEDVEEVTLGRDVTIEEVDISEAVYEVEDMEEESLGGNSDEGDTNKPKRKSGKPSTCHVCSKVLFDLSCLRRHLKTHGIGNHAEHKCEHCASKPFLDRANLTAHTYRWHRHIILAKYKLSPTSLESFKEIIDFELHSISEDGKTCSVCNKVFKKRETTYRHIIQNHAERVGAGLLAYQQKIDASENKSAAPEISESYTLRILPSEEEDTEIDFGVELEQPEDVVVVKGEVGVDRDDEFLILGV